MSNKGTEKLPAFWSGGMFDDFRKEMDDLMEGFFSRRGGLPSLDMTGAVRPAIDIAEDDKAITLTAELPGMTEDQVDLMVSDGVLTLKGEKSITHDSDKDNVHVSERSYGSFQRSFPVPDRVDTDRIEADFDKGVLVVTMPKKAEASGNQRKIKVGG